MVLNIQQLIDAAKGYAVGRARRWPDGVKGPHGGSGERLKRAFISSRRKASDRHAKPVGDSLTT